MTSPRHAYDADEGRGRFYRHPVTGQELVSVTNVLSRGFRKWGLDIWHANSAADYALDNLPSVVVRSRTDRAAVRADIAEAANRLRDSASELGTRIHDLADAHLTGRAIAAEEGDDEAGLYVDQYLRFIKDFGIDLERDIYASEATVADPARGYAGTMDSIVMLPFDGHALGKVQRLPDGERRRWLIDVKSSRKRASTQVYADHPLQLAALRHATELWLPDDTTVRMPTVAGCAILNLRPKTYKLIPVLATVNEHKTFLHILEATKWQLDEFPGEFDQRPLRPDGRFEPKRNAKKETDAA